MKMLDMEKIETIKSSWDHCWFSSTFNDSFRLRELYEP